MEKRKEQAVHDYTQVILESWTYARLTEAERNTLSYVITEAERQGIIRGSYDTRWDILQTIYDAFLAGCGYPTGHYTSWREEPEEDAN